MKSIKISSFEQNLISPTRRILIKGGEGNTTPKTIKKTKKSFFEGDDHIIPLFT